jgi:hypothetical protein
MFGTIRKHQAWLWGLIIIAVSLGMVVVFNPQGSSIFSDWNLTKRGQGGEWGSINGKPITAGEYLDSQNEIKVRYLLHNGKLPPGDEQTKAALERETISRVFLIKKLEEMDVQPSEKAVAVLMTEQIRDHPLDAIEREFLAPNGLTKGDYMRFAKHETGIRQLAATAASSAQLVNPREAEALYRKDHQEVVTQLALFLGSNYLDKVVITNGAIGAYYTNWMAQYRIPERTTLGYVEFSASNCFAQADGQMNERTNLVAAIDEEYRRRSLDTNAFKGTNGLPLSEAEAKNKIKEEVRLQFALQFAHRAASEFGSALIDIKPDPNKIENLDKLAAAKGFPVNVTKPFDSSKGLEEFDDETDPEARTPQESLRDFVRREALKLTDDKPIRFNPIRGKEAVYVIGKKGRIPAELPPLEKVQDQVTNDFKRFVSQQLARSAGQAFHTNLTNGLAQKKTFEQICAEEKVPILNVPPFSLATETITNLDARIKVGLLKNLALDLEVGKASPFIPFSQEGGLVLHVKDRPRLDDAAVQAGLPQFMGQLRIARFNDAFIGWMRRQAEQARLTFPKREPTVGAQN